MSARLLSALVLLACSTVLLAARPAGAGQTSDAVPPGTVTLGPVRISPSISLKDAGVDDNVFNEPVNPKHDVTFTLTPAATVAFRMRRLKLSYQTSTDYVYYRTYTTERGLNTASSARLSLDFGILKPYALVEGVNSRSRPSAEIDARARHRDLSYGGGFTLRIASRTNFVMNGTEGKLAYDPGVEFRGVELRQSFDGRRDAVDAGVAIALTPLTTFSLTVAREQQRFDLSPDRDSNTWRISPTFAFSPIGLVTGTATFGYRRFTPLSPTLPDYSGFVSAVTVGATIYRRNQMQLIFNRDVQYSYDEATAYYLGTGGTLTWTTVLAGPFDVRGMAGRYLMDYKTGGAAGGNDTTTTYGGGVGYRFTNRARVGVNGEWMRRDSTRSADRAFRNHRVFVGLTWGITP
jgi:Putative beta-barrel porin 2